MITKRETGVDNNYYSHFINLKSDVYEKEQMRGYNRPGQTGDTCFPNYLKNDCSTILLIEF